MRYSSGDLFWGFAGIVALAAALGGCSKVQPTTSAAATTAGRQASSAPGRTLVIAETLEPNSLTPVLVEGTLSALVGGILYSFLLTHDAHGNQVPDAATEVPSLTNGGISRDGLRITYHLRRGIRWQDGQPLTARDCIFTFHAIMNPRTNVPDRYGYDKIASVTAPDDRTVIVKLSVPFSPIVDTFLTMESNYPILPAHNLAALPDLNHADVTRPIIGSGPFSLVEWKHGDHITFAANPTYFRGRPRVNRLVMRFVPSAATIVTQLRTHEIDAALELDDPALYAQLNAVPDTHVVATPAFALVTAYFNMQRGLTVDRRLRQAIAQAVDTDVIVKDATHGLYDSKNALRGEFAADAEANPARYDPAAARALLDAAGWKAGADGMRSKHGRPLALSVILVGTNQMSTSVGLEFREQLRAVGIDLAIRSFTSEMMKAPAADGGPMFGGRFDVALAEIYSSAGPFAAQFFICSERAPTGFNLSRTCNPVIDQLFGDIIAASDPQRRSRDAHSIQRILAVDMPQIPLGQVRTMAVVSNRVHGIEPTPLTPFVGLEKWSIDR